MWRAGWFVGLACIVVALPARAADPGWTTVEEKSLRLNFVCDMPGEPERTEQKTNNGETLEIDHELKLDERSLTFKIDCNEPKAKSSASPEAILTMGRDLMVRLPGVRVISEKRLKVGEYPARDLTCKLGPYNFMRLRLVAADSACYVLSVVGGVPARPNDPDIDKFFDSFRFVRATPDSSQRAEPSKPSSAGEKRE